MFVKLKRNFSLLLLILSVSACSTHTTLQLPLAGETFQLPVNNEDKILIGDFILLKSNDSYLSLQVLNATAEHKEYGINAMQLVQQLYGFEQPAHKDLAQAKQVFAAEIIAKTELKHPRFFALHIKEQGGRERIIFTPKKSDALVYYILDAEGKDPVEFFNGVK